MHAKVSNPRTPAERPRSEWYDCFGVTAKAIVSNVLSCIPDEVERRVKRRPSECSEPEDGFKGFDLNQQSNLTGYCQVLGKT